MKAVKYILLITLILFVLVFLFTLPGRLNKENNNESSSVSETSSSESTSGDSAETSSESGTDAITVGGEPENTTTTAGVGDDSMKIDNTWAFFLVNQKNPLPDDYTFTTKVVQDPFVMDERCADYMINMLADAKADGINLNIVSAYRSVEKQQQLFDKDTADYEAQGYSHEEAVVKTATAVAIPGQSEHNAGFAADILDEGNYNLTEDFENTEEYKWLSENAENYGFILRYPKNKEDITGIEYEPWHYRFVGLYYAKKVNESGLCLEEYFEQMQ